MGWLNCLIDLSHFIFSLDVSKQIRMPAPNTHSISADHFTQQPEVLRCIAKLEAKYGKAGERLIVSDVIDNDGHQYVNLVQKGGGVLGIALVGYTYILEQMNIRFIRLAGTSAGAINTALMTVIGAELKDEGGEKKVKGNKKMAKSEAILDVINNLNFIKLVDGHPVARFLIQKFITHKDFTKQISQLLTWIAVILLVLPVLDLVCLGLQYKIDWFSYVTKGLFILTGFYLMLIAILAGYLAYLVKRLKNAGFGINPGDYFYDWIKKLLTHHHVKTVSDLIAVAETPVDDLHLRNKPAEHPADLHGDVTFIASEIVSQNKIEFPKMWKLFTKDINTLQPAGFVRASMAIPIFFESYFINNIPCKDEDIKKEWLALDEEDPPSVARFVDGGILSNFPLNLFFNSNVDVPRLPSFGIDLDDEKTEADVFTSKDMEKEVDKDEGKNAAGWSLGDYLYRIFNTVRFYYDKDFLIKNRFFKKGIGIVPLKGYNWLKFFLKLEEKQQMFVLGAKAATKFLHDDFDWEDYKSGGIALRQDLKQKDEKQPL